MKILVTGGRGFVGSHLISRLADSGHDVYSLERYVTGRYVLGGKQNVKTVYGDLLQYFAVRKIIREVQPEVVIHLASITAVSYSYDHPLEVLDANFSGTVNLAEACMRENPDFSHFLFAGTSEEYGNQKEFPIKEDAELHPNSPYSVSKVAADKYLEYMYAAFDFPMTIMRNFNTYGRKDNTHFVVERTLVQMLQGGPVRLGEPTPVRDFLYVDDHVESYLKCMNNEKAMGEVFNICTGRGVSISDLAKLLAKHVNYDGEIIWNTIPQRPLDIAVLVGDHGKAKRILNWSPKYSLEQGLKIIIKYWKGKLKEEASRVKGSRTF